MGRFSKRTILGLTAALTLVAGGAFAQNSVVDDFENGGAENEFGQYWFFFDDAKEASTITGESRTTKSTITNGKYEVNPKTGEMEIKFTADNITQTQPHGGLQSAVMTFKYGGTMQMAYDNRPGAAYPPAVTECPASNGTYGCYDFEPFMGIGTNISADGATSAPEGFGSATTVRYWAKADKAMTAQFKLVQSHVEGSADFFVEDAITTAWAEYVHPITGTEFEQPTWAADRNLTTTFQKDKTTKLQWQFQAGVGTNPAPASAEGETGTFWLDDVSIDGFEFTRWDVCKACVGAVGQTVGSLFTDFEANAINKLGWYWYAYNDNEAVTDDDNPGTSEFTDGVDMESAYGRELILSDQGSGSNGAYIAFTLGGNLTIDGNDVAPFVGLGTNLFDDSDSTDFYNATEAETEGVYFEYMTSPDMKLVDVELQDETDLREGRPASAVRYIKLQGTNGQWKGATVAFSRLVLHEEWEDVQEWMANNPSKVNLDYTKLAKLQIKYQGGSGSNGYLAIDNVRLLNAGESSVKHASSKARAAGLRATYNRGVVGVSWNTAQSVASGKVSLINVRGRTVASAALVKAGNKVTANLGKGTIPTGMYFVRINAKDLNGKKIVQQVPLSVVR